MVWSFDCVEGNAFNRDLLEVFDKMEAIGETERVGGTELFVDDVDELSENWFEDFGFLMLATVCRG